MEIRPSPRKEQQIVAKDDSPEPISIRKLDRLETTHTSTGGNGG